jgi:hypothetical protein
MKSAAVTVALLLGLIAFANAFESGTKTATTNDPLPVLVNVDQIVIPTAGPAATATDSLYLIGGPGVLSGRVETAGGLPGRQGWTGTAIYKGTDTHWQVSSYRAAELDQGTPDNHAWWCGAYFDPCYASDPAAGYGKSWLEFLDWYGTVPDPGSDVTVRVRAILNCDTEPSLDFLFLQVNNSEWMENLVSYSTRDTAVVVDVSATLTPDYFVGVGTDQIHLRWSFNSDGGWDDEDCMWPTDGAAQIDLIEVFFDQGSGEVQIGTTETCESGTNLQ